MTRNILLVKYFDYYETFIKKSEVNANGGTIISKLTVMRIKLVPYSKWKYELIKDDKFYLLRIHRNC